MSKSYNGVNIVHEGHTESSVETVSSSFDEEPTRDKFPLQTGFRGYISIPQVRLERYDITPYLNGHKRLVQNTQIKRGKNDSIHKKRLSQKCFVNLTRYDLEKLKVSYQSKYQSALSPATSSDSEASNSTDMIVNCKICNKTYNSEKKLLKHQQKKHIILCQNSKAQKRVSFSDHVIVHEVMEYHECQKVDYIYPKQYMELVDKTNNEPNTININNLKKAVVDPKSRKTIVSRHQCETCGKYFSNNYCLNRHISTQHQDLENLRCNVCEEVFVWPSLLKSHKCIRLNLPEMPFDDARAEILLDNPNRQNGFDDLNIEENDDYMNSVDFEIPTPIVELRECDSTYMTNSVVHNDCSVLDKNGVTSSGYKLIMQEVPIEF